MKIYIPIEAYTEVMNYVLASDIEVSGMGQMIPYKDGMKVTRVHILKQECSSVETELDDEEMAALLYECEEGRYKLSGDLCWWWHSHVDMDVFWSGTDNNAIHKLAEGGRIFATVFNKKWRYRSRYRQDSSSDGYYPVVDMDNIETVIICSEEAKETISKMVTKPKPPVAHNWYGGNRRAVGNWYNSKRADTSTPDTPAKFSNSENSPFINEAKSKNETRQELEEARILAEYPIQLSAELGVSITITEMVVEEFIDIFGLPRDLSEVMAYYKAHYQEV